MPYVPKRNIYTNPDWLVDGIEQKIGIEIAPPENEGGLFKLKLKKGSFDERDLWSLYAAWRINCLIDGDSSIAEIGAGMGKIAMYIGRFGFKDYSIFDLPIMNVIQAWYLIRSLPNRKIILYGEIGETEDSIKVMPYWAFNKSNKRYSLVLNQDSFPEINREVNMDYLAKIKRCAQHLLSINHEHQAPLFPGSDNHNLVVPSLIEASGGFQRIYRFPFWLRKGYVEEFYKVTGE